MRTFKGISVCDLPANYTEAVYTFVDNEGEATHIAVGPLLERIKRAGVVPQMVGMGASLLDAIERGDLNQEEDHALRLPEEALDVPIIVGHWDNKHIIIDGSHRLWRRYKRGDRDFPAYVIPEAAWRHFVIVDMPGSGAFWDHHNRTSKVR